MIVFVHIPKTGGTSIRTAAEAYFGEEHVLNDYGPDAPRTSPVVRELLYERDDIEALVQHIQRSNIEFLSGHFKLDRYKPHLPTAHFVTWLRNPIDRVVSLHAHRTRIGLNDAPLPEFSERPRFRNGQVIQAGDTSEEYTAIGFLEDHARSVTLLNERLGIDLAVRHDNVSASKPSELDVELGEKIAFYNTLDVAFVDKARRFMFGEGG